VRTLLEPEVEATLAPDTHVLALFQQYLKAHDVDQQAPLSLEIRHHHEDVTQSSSHE
jgi:hypothetical protein